MTPTQDKHEQVTPGQLKPGDTVLIDGVLKTVSQSSLGHDELLGPTLWGDSYRSGRDKVTKVTFAAEIERQKASQT